jgi:predicted phosphodiesterase
LRLIVLADVHANLPALEAVLADAGQQAGVQAIIVAGDFLTHGPQPAETLALLQDYGCMLIQGNGEGYLTGPPQPHLQGAFWTYSQLDAEALRFVADLPQQRVVALPGTAAVRVLHGSPASTSGRLYPDRNPELLAQFRAADLLTGPVPPLDTLLAGIAEPVVICGHTHIQWQQAWARGLALNPGTVGNPLDGDVRARYAELAWDGAAWRAELRAVPYDLERAVAAFYSSGYLDGGGVFARACLRNIETGYNFVGWFINHARALAARAGLAPGSILPAEIWQAAEATFDWCAGRCAQAVA